MASPPATGGTPGLIAHDFQTEGYYIVSGGGTLITGGHIVNGRKSPSLDINGPTCGGGMTYGSDIVGKVVKTGDIIIIPARLDGNLDRNCSNTDRAGSRMLGADHNPRLDRSDIAKYTDEAS